MSNSKETANQPVTACMLGYFLYDYDARIQNYVNILMKEGYSVDVIGLGKENYQVNSGEAKLSVIALKDRSQREKNIFHYIWNLIHFFILAMVKVSILNFRKKYRFIHVHNVPDFLVFTAWLPKLAGVKIILDIHDILPEFYAMKFQVNANNVIITVLKYIEKLSCWFADHVIVANDIWRDTLIKRSVNAQKCTSIINYPDTSLFHPKSELKPETRNGCFTLIYHGTFTEYHGLDIAVKAVNILRNKIEGIKLLVYGGGTFENNLRILIRSLGVENYIEIREKVSLQQVPEILKCADIGIVPKKDGLFVGEAISTKLFQYTAMGIPSVVSRTVAEQRYFREDEIKFFTPGDPVDMARCIQELYENPQARIDMAQRALRKMDEYSLKANSKKYLGIIDSLNQTCL